MPFKGEPMNRKQGAYKNKIINWQTFKKHCNRDNLKYCTFHKKKTECKQNKCLTWGNLQLACDWEGLCWGK